MPEKPLKPWEIPKQTVPCQKHPGGGGILFGKRELCWECWKAVAEKMEDLEEGPGASLR